MAQLLRIHLQCKRHRLHPWVGKIPWDFPLAQPTPIFLPGEPHGQRSLASYSPWGQKELDIAAAAKSLQSCPTLCNPIDCSPPGSPVLGILLERTLGWVAISFSSA